LRRDGSDASSLLRRDGSGVLAWRLWSFDERRRSSGETAVEFRRTAAEFRRNGSRVPVKWWDVSATIDAQTKILVLR
jgi:hypothetical protein